MLEPGRKGTTSCRSAKAWAFGPVSAVADVSQLSNDWSTWAAERGLYRKTFALTKLTRFARRTVAPVRASISRS